MRRLCASGLAALALLVTCATSAVAQRDLSLPKPGEPESVAEALLRADNAATSTGQILTFVAAPTAGDQFNLRWLTPNASDFTVTATELQHSSQVSTFGTCVGDNSPVSGEFCSTVDFGGNTLDGDSSTNIFSPIYGGTGAGSALQLFSTTNSTKGEILLQNGNHTTSGSYVYMRLQPAGTTVSLGGTSPAVTGLTTGGTYSFTANPSSFGALVFFQFNGVVSNSGSRTMQFVWPFASQPWINAATGTTLSGSNWNVAAFASYPRIGSAGTNTMGRVVGFESGGYTSEAGTDSVTDWIGLRMATPAKISGGDVAITNMTAVKVESLSTGVTATNKYSMWSVDTAALFRHAGPATVGSDADPNTSAVVDMVGTTKGFLPPRVTQANLPTCNSTNVGMTAYCTDCAANDCTTGGSTTNGEGCMCVRTGTSTFAYAVLTN